MIEAGDILAQKYRIEGLLGKGGMGYVFSAVHQQLGQRVAVKFMAPQLSRNPEAVARFLREARSCVRIAGEHVARVLDVGTHVDGTPYMVMEFLSGFDLAVELDRRGTLPFEEAVDYVLQACEALAEAHAQGLVHRDLKPSNLFLTHRPDGSPLVKVLDFGISKAVADADGVPGEVTQSLTESQHVLGSPHYMSPEQVRAAKTLDARSDIWMLGIILYELICGKRPFEGDTSMAILAAVISDPTPDLLDLAPHVPRELSAVVTRCLQKSPSQRFASVAELARALEPLARPESRPIATRIEGIARAGAKARAGSAESPAKALENTASATLQSELDSPYGVEPPTVSDPRTPSMPMRPRSRFLLPVAALVTVAFGTTMYAVGALRPNQVERKAFAPVERLTSAAASPNASASTPSKEAARGNTASTPSATPRALPRAKRGPTGIPNPLPLGMATTATTAVEPPRSAPRPERPVSDPFDQRR